MLQPPGQAHAAHPAPVAVEGGEPAVLERGQAGSEVVGPWGCSWGPILPKSLQQPRGADFLCRAAPSCSIPKHQHHSHTSQGRQVTESH